VKCCDISMEWGYVLHLTQSIHQLTRKAITAGGEILERFRLSRERHSSGDAKDLAKNIQGYAIGAQHGGV